MNALSRIKPSSIIPTAEELQTMRTLAQEFVASGLLPPEIKTPAAALFIIQKGRELGIPPAYALSNIVVVRGKPTCSAELMLALIKRDHGRDALHIVETTPEYCTIEYQDGSHAGTFTFTIDDAKRANLTSNPIYTTYPGPMLRARAISAVARMAFPDSIAGMYTPEELGATVDVDSDGTVRIVALPEEPVAERTAPPPDGEAPPALPAAVEKLTSRIAAYIKKSYAQNRTTKELVTGDDLLNFRRGLASAMLEEPTTEIDDKRLHDVDDAMVIGVRTLLGRPDFSWETLTRAEAAALRHASSQPEFADLFTQIVDAALPVQ